MSTKGGQREERVPLFSQLPGKEVGWPVGMRLLAEPHPSSVIRTPRVVGGGLLPWWPVCREFLRGESGDIYTQGQGERGQAAEARRAGTGLRAVERPLAEVCRGQVGLGVSCCLSQHFHLCPQAARFPYKGRFWASGTSCW